MQEESPLANRFSLRNCKAIFENWKEAHWDVLCLEGMSRLDEMQMKDISHSLAPSHDFN